jgi:hypothetical protein
VLACMSSSVTFADEPPGNREARQTPAIRACSLLPKAEVKKHLPWIAALDQMPAEEEAVGKSGSSCNYPSVFIQILPFAQGTIDAFKKSGGMEAISGVGDEAYFRNNKDRYAEVLVRAGKYLVTLQANVDNNMATVKANAVNLAKALVAKLKN